MRGTRIIRFLALSALTVSVCWAGWRIDRSTLVLAEPQATITITQPDGVDDVVGNGDDFATTVLGDPWDMSEHTDIMALHGLPDSTISGGVLHFTMDSSSENVRLLFPGLEGREDVGKIGMNYPIDASHYHWLAFRMYHPGGLFRIKWFYDRYAQPDREYVTSSAISVVPGWHTYIIDLDTIGIAITNGGATEWNGLVREFQIIPIASAGTEITIDWVRLTADNPITNSLDISWTGLSSPGSDVEFYLDSDDSGCDGALIHTESGASESGSFTWQQAGYGIASPANVAPGNYYVCAKVGGTEAGYSSGQLTVDHAPIIHFTQPSFTSGDDYATDAGNPWDMSDTGDVDHVVDGSYAVNSGILGVTVPASKVGVQVHLNLPTSIDSDSYHYLTYRLWFDYDYGFSDVGQQTRVFWGRAPDTETTSGLIYVYPGWQTYSVDLRSLSLHSGPTWTTADWTIFRIDPIANHTGETVTFYIDDVKLTGDEEADAVTDIEWELTDPDTSVTTMTLYYDGDQSGLNGTHIATLTLTDGERTGLAMFASGSTALGATSALTETVYLPLVARNYVVPCEGACYTWYTGDVPAGAYYLYACMDDGRNELCRYSETPIHISH